MLKVTRQAYVTSFLGLHQGLLNIRIVCQRSSQNIDNNIRFTDIYQHVVLQNLHTYNKETYKWLFLAHKNSISNTQISYKVCLAFNIELDLEMSTSMLLWCRFIFVWDHKIVYHAFLNIIKQFLTMVVDSLSRLDWLAILMLFLHPKYMKPSRESSPLASYSLLFFITCFYFVTSEN